jgi:hypothetical protein
MALPFPKSYSKRHYKRLKPNSAGFLGTWMYDTPEITAFRKTPLAVLFFGNSPAVSGCFVFSQLRPQASRLRPFLRCKPVAEPLNDIKEHRRQEDPAEGDAQRMKLLKKELGQPKIGVIKFSSI